MAGRNQQNPKKRKILHVDLDAFFASVEELDNPSLKNKPMAVGGLSQTRGIVTTCNYTAREYGIHSAMPVFQALQRCPDLIIVPTRRDRYVELSKEVFKILRSYTRRLEQMSIDEAYLDISTRPESSNLIGKSIQDEVLEKTGLSLSVGISYNKFLAKLASDWKKPHGHFEIKEEDMPEILFPLPVAKVHGIGRVAEQKLNALGIYTVEDLYRFDQESLIKLFGKAGVDIYNFIRGKDDRPVETYRERKSIGIERTFEKNISVRKELEKLIDQFSVELAEDLEAKNIAARTLHLKLKSASFQTITRSHTTDAPIQEASDIQYLAHYIFDEIQLSEPVRLLGISASNLTSSHIQQLNFIDLINE